MTRKLLFLVFTDEACRQNHALLYATDLRSKGHDVKVILEGAATGSFRLLDDKESMFSRLFARAKDMGIIAGACKRASGGCATGREDRNVADIVEREGVQMLSDLEGHAGIEAFVRDGYEVIVF